MPLRGVQGLAGGGNNSEGMEMHMMKCIRLFIAAWVGIALVAKADELTIQSFSGTGQLAFNRVSTAQAYLSRPDFRLTLFVGCY